MLYTSHQEPWAIILYRRYKELSLGTRSKQWFNRSSKIIPLSEYLTVEVTVNWDEMGKEGKQLKDKRATTETAHSNLLCYGTHLDSVIF